MKISLNWLKDYIDLNNISVDEIVSNLTMSGLEVEEVIDETQIYKDFIVGYVKDKAKHPNADKLSLCTVFTGNEYLQVICGAPNVDAGQKVVFAPVGTVIPKGKFKIGKAKIRGIESFGMICAEDELELSDDHSGIMVLDENLKEGTPISEALGLNDVVMEIAITPNRPDALSHFGVALDLAALFNLSVKKNKISLSESSEKIENAASVEIEDEKNCPRYTAKVVKGVTIKESPIWLKERLSSIGLRPINNIVDVTNYVMYETGQPLHAFDLNRLKGNKIIVKSTEKEEKFITLDSKERILPAGTLMICDSEKPVAVAGVMGGENSEIYSDTKEILIESAHFNTSSIRKTSKALSLSTEASYRFERGVDPNGTLYSAERAAQLIAQLCDGEILAGTIDIYPNKIEELEITVRVPRVTKILGYNIQKEKIVQILEKLGFKLKEQSDSAVTVLVPTFRPDVEREIDIIEEIARINGYDNIPTISKISVTLGAKHDESEFVDNLRSTANSLGFWEIINNPLQSEKLASLVGNKIHVLNPQSLDMAFLRTSLIPGALATVASNLNVGEKNLQLFEIGNVFNKNSDSKIESFDDFTETQKLILITTGLEVEKTWIEAEKSFNFYNLKGLVNSLLINISLDNVLNDSYYHDENTTFDFTFVKSYKSSKIGIGGRIKPEVLKQFGIEQNVFCFEFDISLLKNITKPQKKFNELLKFPKVIRDFAFIFDKSVTYQSVADFIIKKSSSLLKSVQLFDLFEKESLGENKKSMAFTLEYYDKSRTLTEEEVEKEFTNLITAITNNFNAKLRGN